HGFVLIDGFCQAGNEERRERQGLSSDRFVLPEVSARPGHIDFEQAMDHGLVLDGTKHGRHPPPDLRIGDHLIISMLLFHALSPSLAPFLQPHRTRKRIGYTTLTATLHPVERLRFSLKWVR